MDKKNRDYYLIYIYNYITQDDAFAAYYDISGEDSSDESSEDKQHCFCFRMRKGNEADMFPARIVDYSETVFNDDLDEITCNNSFSLR